MFYDKTYDTVKPCYNVPGYKGYLDIAGDFNALVFSYGQTTC